jgi:hypothetical protein
VILECANGAFHPIAAMHVWRDKLEGGIPLEGDCFFIGGAGFVIQDLEINGEPLGRQTCHNGVVCCNVVAVALGFESLLEDEVAIGMEGNHDVLVAGLCSDGERPVSLVKSLLSGFVMAKTWLEGVAMGGGRTTRGAGKVDLAFVNRTFWHCWARWPVIVSLASGQYLAALEQVRPLKVLQLLALIASSQVCLTVKPRQA